MEMFISDLVFEVLDMIFKSFQVLKTDGVEEKGFLFLINLGLYICVIQLNYG